MVNNKSRISKILSKIIINSKYAAVGGQAVIEGVMMRSPNAFVVALRVPNGKILLRRDQWFGLSKKFEFFRKPFFRGVLTLIESMANGIVSLNYSANIAMKEELKEKALKKGKSLDDLEKELKTKEKVSLGTILTMGFSFALGMGLFVFLPHAITAWLSYFFGKNWVLESFEFHAVDGLIKAFIFILYIFLIGLFPDVRRVFEYHGAEHKSIATFEAKEELTVENARKYSTLHPRCGTSFVFFLLFISIIIFSVLFAIFPVGVGSPIIVKHVMAIFSKIILMFPIAGISYEVIKFAGKHSNNQFCKALSFPGMMLQKLTTKEPSDEQLEVGLASLKAVLELEKKFNLKETTKKVLTLDEVEVDSLESIDDHNAQLKDFLEN